VPTNIRSIARILNPISSLIKLQITTFSINISFGKDRNEKEKKEKKEKNNQADFPDPENTHGGSGIASSKIL